MSSREGRKGAVAVLDHKLATAPVGESRINTAARIVWAGRGVSIDKGKGSSRARSTSSGMAASDWEFSRIPLLWKPAYVRTGLA